MDHPLFGKVKAREIQKEELLSIFKDVFAKTGLSVNSDEKVVGIKPEKALHMVRTDKSEYHAHNILLAICRR